MTNSDNQSIKTPQQSATERISVLIVSEFETGEKNWSDERQIVEALAQQDFDTPYELIIVESTANQNIPPPKEIAQYFPDVKILYHDSECSAALKNYGVEHIQSEWTFVLEADAMPQSGWLRFLWEAAQAHSEYDIFTGRTNYGLETSWQRALSLLDRTFDNLKSDGPSNHISTNSALYKTEILKKFPFPEEAPTPFVAAFRRDHQIWLAGYKSFYVKNAVVRHGLSGFDFVMDFRRNNGFADMMAQKNPSVWRIPDLLYRRVRSNLGSIWRFSGEYWRWYDWPLGAFLFFFSRVPETIGMFYALGKDKRLPHSAHR